MIRLEKITEENLNECINLDPGVINEDFADSFAYSLAEAWFYYPAMKPFAISRWEKFSDYKLFYCRRI